LEETLFPNLQLFFEFVFVNKIVLDQIFLRLLKNYESSDGSARKELQIHYLDIPKVRHADKLDDGHEVAVHHYCIFDISTLPWKTLQDVSFAIAGF